MNKATAIVRISAIFRTSSRFKEIVTEHLWYDIDAKKMLKFTGGQLKFQYDVAARKTKVGVEPLFVKSQILDSDMEDIRKWFNENEDEFGLKMVEDTGRWLTFSFEYDEDDRKEKKIGEVEDSMYAKRFDYYLVKNA